MCIINIILASNCGVACVTSNEALSPANDLAYFRPRRLTNAATASSLFPTAILPSYPCRLWSRATVTGSGRPEARSSLKRPSAIFAKFEMKTISMYNHSFDYASVGVRLTQGILDKTPRPMLLETATQQHNGGGVCCLIATKPCTSRDAARHDAYTMR